MMPKLLLKSLRSIFAVLVAAALLSGCTVRLPGGGTSPQGNGEGILGRSAVATLQNSRIRCDFVDLGELRYEVHCYTVVFTGAGEVRATSYAPNVQAVWSTVQQIMGPALTSLSCTVATNLLEQTCEARMASPAQVELAYALELKDTQTNETRTEPARVILPYTVATFGAIPELPVQQGRALVAGTDESPVGIQAPQLPLVGLPFFFTGAFPKGKDLYLRSGNFLYHLSGDLAETKLHLYAGKYALDSTTDLTPTDSHRLRMLMAGAVAQREDELFLVRNTSGVKSLHTVPESGPSKTTELPSGFAYGSLYAAPDGSFYGAGSGVVNKWNAENGLQPIAGIGTTQPSGHVETAEATSLFLNIKQMVGISNTAVLVRDDSVKRFVRINSDNTYQVLLSLTDLPADNRCWDIGNHSPSAAVNAAGKIFILWRSCSSTHLFEIVGNDKTSSALPTFPGTYSGGSADCALFPSAGSQVTAAQFPFSLMGLSLVGTDRNGLVLAGYCGLARYNLTTQKVEVPVTSKLFSSSDGVGVGGIKATQAFFHTPKGIGIGAQGEVFVSAANALITIQPRQDTLTSVPLTLNGSTLPGFSSHWVSPGGQNYIYSRAFGTIYRVGETGALTSVALFRLDGANTASANMVTLAFESERFVYANYEQVLEKVDLSDGTRTPLFSFSSVAEELRVPRSMTVGADNALYLLYGDKVARFFPLDATGTLKIIAGGGSAAPAENGLTHEMAFPSNSLKKIYADKQGILYVAETTKLKAFTPVGTLLDGTPTYSYSSIYPTSGSIDCSGGIAAPSQSTSFEQFLQVLNGVCPADIEAMFIQDKCSEGGSVTIALARKINYLGSLLLMSKPCQ